jgi:hypothetical protein
MSYDSSELVKSIQLIAEKLNKTPTKVDCIANGMSEHQIKKFGFVNLLNQAGYKTLNHRKKEIDTHEMVSKIKEIYQEFDRIPTIKDCVDYGIIEFRLDQIGITNLIKMSGIEELEEAKKKDASGLKILVLDIETAPILAWVWGLWENNVALNQIDSDWYVMSWAAKWLGEEEVFYMDQRDAENIENDKNILEGIWKLLDQADVIVSQNGKKFDRKKLNARFILNGMHPPSSARDIDTLVLAKKHFAFTSNKLEYMTSKLCTKYKKLTHKNFPGFMLWAECIKGNLLAWNEMREYNTHDILSLEELYEILRKWGIGINLNVNNDTLENKCVCGNTKFIENGFAFTNGGKFTRLKCTICSAEFSDKVNLLPKEKKKALFKL